jgi:EXPERA (EXPanded EBP superfamily)
VRVPLSLVLLTNPGLLLSTFPSIIFFYAFIAFALSSIDYNPAHARASIATQGREYAAADIRWGTADPTVVALELLTVFGAAPLAAFIVYQIVKGDPTRYYWIIVLSTAELYGGYVVLYSPSPHRGQASKWI